MCARKKNKIKSRQSAKAKYLAGLHRQEFEKIVHLFTEGATEAQYIQDIAKDRCVKVFPECQPISSPHVLMQKARDWAFDKRELFFSKDGKALKEGEKHSIWVLFDDDEKTGEIQRTIAELNNPPTGVSPAKFKQAKMPVINIGYMKPCVELWGGCIDIGYGQGFAQNAWRDGV